MGTIQSNRVGLPKEVVQAKNRENLSYEIFWDEANGGIMNLHSYVVITKSKGKKNVLLLSTVETILRTTKGYKANLPASIQLYNFTKGGTDIGKSNLCFRLFRLPPRECRAPLILGERRRGRGGRGEEVSFLKKQ